MFGLDYILSPMSAETFLGEHWGRRALLISGKSDKFERLFGWDDINHALTHSRLRHPDVVLLHEKRSLPAEALSQLDAWLRKGATLVLNHVQVLDPLLDRFASVLARDMNTTVNINCYTSWPAKQGFDTHYDRHDVFVVQVAGRKAWTVFEPTRRWPLEREHGPTPAPEGMTPYLECTLTPGDVLYVPRGHWHYALAETPSIHLTVGPSARTGFDFLAWLAEQLTSSDELMRKDFPLPGARMLGGSRPETELLAHWREVRDRLVETLTNDATLDGFLQFCMTRNPTRRAYQLPHLVLLEDEITLETRFVMAPDQKALVRYDPESRSAAVTVRGHVLNFEHVPERLLEVFFGMTGEIRGADLVSACPELRPEEIRRFLLQMFQQDILRLGDENPG